MAKLKDLTGQKFGRLTVLERAEDHIQPSGCSVVMWKCKCDCGAVKIVRAAHLRSNHTQSCGCLRKERAREATFIDLTGQRFHRWTVINQGENLIVPSGEKFVRWNTVCDCGNKGLVLGTPLRNGQSKSCGCYQKEIASELNLKDLTGQRFGKLVVLERVEDHITSGGNSIVKWKCKCDCGKITFVRTDSLKRGDTKSCGCIFHSPKSNLIGKRFNRLVVKEWAFSFTDEDEEYHRGAWLSQCDCGRMILSSTTELKTGHTESCGCLAREILLERNDGETNPSWKGGITPLYAEIRNSPKYKEWREAVLERDNYICQISNIETKDLNVHHKKPFYQIIEDNCIDCIEEALECEELWNIDNGITISEKWHSGIKTDNPKAFHRIYGCRSFTEENFYEWKDN
ncbi:MAG: hypothetical protein HKP62_04540 [Sulfurovum sp.]|nr:hypothetical protein [Sulfurovum sp.]NNJ45266.1 hypothetical protein [Sulfurovum sp.]